MTPRFCHGLIVGKFYPPHVGHHRLIEEAAAQCDEISVIVMAAQGESVPLDDRLAWLRAAHGDQPNVSVLGIACDAPVDYADATVWAAQIELIRAALRQRCRPTVDAAFGNEAYVQELALRLSATPVISDCDRRRVAISSTEIRADLAGCWDLLAAPTRAGLATRVVVLGAESTGTTTVAEALAGHYRPRGGVWKRTHCVPEFGREFTATKWEQALAIAAANGQPAPPLDGLVWTANDFDLVAETQSLREEQAAGDGSPLLICDTDAFATSIWERRYLGAATRPEQTWAKAGLPRHDAYLLTSHVGVTWCDDGLREGDLAVRAAMTGWFADALTQAGHSWVLLTGDLAERVALAVRVIDHLLAHRLTFGPAITDPPSPEPDEAR